MRMPQWVFVERFDPMSEPEGPESEDAKTPGKRLRATIIVAICLFFLDSVIFHQLSVAMIASVVLVFWLIPAALFSLKRREIAKTRALKALVYLIMVVAISVAFFANNRLAEERAKGLIAVINKFQVEHNRYPLALEELVPTYLPSVPRANFTLTGRFFYSGYGDSTSLMYYTYFPFARRYFRFKSQTWTLID
jgi:hypothetical protein